MILRPTRRKVLKGGVVLLAAPAIIRPASAWWQSVAQQSVGGATYAGPGDVVPSALAWWGLRAYSAAAVGGNCVRIIRASDSAQQDFVTLSGGSLDVASIATFLTATTGKIVTLYDQSGGGRNLTNATDAQRPAYTASTIGSLPGMTFTYTGNSQLNAASSLTTTQPFSTSYVAERTGHFVAYGSVLNASPMQAGFNATVDTAFIYTAGPIPTGTASDSAFHAVQDTFNGASSEVYVDGSGTSGDLGNTTGLASAPGMGGASGNPLDGIILEGGIWGGAFSSGDKSGLNSNQHTYWGF